MRFKKEIGNRIKWERKNKEISQEELAELINVHPNLIGYIERGEIDTGHEKIYKICKALSIKVTDLYSGY